MVKFSRKVRFVLALLVPAFILIALWAKIGTPTFDLFPEVWYFSASERATVNALVRNLLVVIPSLIAYCFALYWIAISRLFGTDVSQMLAQWRWIWKILERGSSSNRGAFLGRSFATITVIAGVLLLCLWSFAPPSSTKVVPHTAGEWKKETATRFDSNLALAKRRLNSLIEQVKVKSGSSNIRKKVGEPRLADARTGLNTAVFQAQKAETMDEVLSSMPQLIEILAKLEALETRVD